MANPSVDASASHAIYVERLASTNANKIDPILKSLSTFTRSRLAEEGGIIPNKRAMNAIIRDIDKRYMSEYGEWEKETGNFLNDLTEYETQLQTDILDAETTDEFTPKKPSDKQVKEEAEEQPMAIGANGGAVAFTALVAGFARNETDKAINLVRSGFYEGRNTSDISTAITGTRRNRFADGVMAQTKRNATSVSKTSANHVSTIASDTVYKKNKRAVLGYIITAVLDNRTSKICRGWDDTRISFEDSYQPRPPFHINCLVGDTDIATCSSVSRVFKRWYEGDAIEITTESGKSMTITPNHPILTGRGWVAAKLVDSSDKLLTIPDWGKVADHKENGVVSKFSDIFSAFDVSFNSIFISESPPTAKDFHGDFSNSKIKIVDVGSLAGRGIKSSIFKYPKDSLLMIRTRVASSLNGCGSFLQRIFRYFSTLRRLISRPCHGFLLFFSRPIHSGLLLGTSVSNFSKVGFKKPSYGVFGTFKAKMVSYSAASYAAIVSIYNGLFFRFRKGDNPISLFDSALRDYSSDDLIAASVSGGNLGEAFAGLVEFDHVVSVNIKKISEHVYNLENEGHWYISNGIITHNCRTTTRPWLRDDLDAIKQAQRQTKGADGKIYENTAKQYYTWLKEQPAWFQDDVLGVTEGKIFRNAGLTPQEFKAATRKRDGTPLTIAEMSEKDKRIKQYLTDL